MILSGGKSTTSTSKPPRIHSYPDRQVRQSAEHQGMPKTRQSTQPSNPKKGYVITPAAMESQESKVPKIQSG